MNLGKSVKKELCRLEVKDKAMIEYEFYAMLTCAASLIFMGKGTRCLFLSTPDAAIARRIYKISKELYSLTPLISAKKRSPNSLSSTYELLFDNNELVNMILSYYLLNDEDNPFVLKRSINFDYLNSSSARRRFLRGAFLVSGTLSVASKNTHMEISCLKSELARDILTILSKEEIKANSIERKNTYGVYLKSYKSITSFLAMIGAHETALAVESEKVLTQMKADTNRRRNCDIANISKSVDTGVYQANAFNLLMNHERFESLSDPLKETLLLRVANPECSIKDLSSLFMGGISKSTLNKRLMRLVEICKEENIIK